MSSLPQILALYGLLTLLAMLIAVLLATPQLGLPYLLSSRDEKREPHGLAGRAQRAAQNSVAAMALFAPAALLVGAGGPQAVLAGQIFLIARVLYLPCYIFGVAYARTVVWLAGFLTTAYLYVLAL